jgi:hypothetical protein
VFDFILTPRAKLLAHDWVIGEPIHSGQAWHHESAERQLHLHFGLFWASFLEACLASCHVALAVALRVSFELLISGSGFSPFVLVHLRVETP